MRPLIIVHDGEKEEEQGRIKLGHHIIEGGRENNDAAYDNSELCNMLHTNTQQQREAVKCYNNEILSK